MTTVTKFEAYRRKFMHVEIVICLGAFCGLLLNPLKTEYTYQVVAAEHNASTKVITDCSDTNISQIDIIVSKRSSKWSLYFDLCMFVPAIVTSMLLTSWGDRVGRRTVMGINITGQIIGSAFLALSIHFRWPLGSLYVSNVVAGLTGYIMTLLTQGNAYLSDITTVEARGLRFVILETCVGVGGGVAGICSGFWIESAGFFQPVLITTILLVISLLFIPLLPNEKRFRQPDYEGSDKSYESPEEKKSYKEIVRSMKEVYFSEYSHCHVCFGDYSHSTSHDDSSKSDRCRHGGGWYPGRVWKIWSYLVIYNGVMAAMVGSMAIQTIYFMSKPLCFTKVQVGLQQGLRFGATAVSPILVLLYQKVLHLSSDVIILISLVGFTAYYLLIAFSSASWTVFLATTIGGFSMVAKPFTQSQLSSLVSESEHGVAFALLSCTELITFLLSTVVFLMIYQSTLQIYNGLVWIIITTMLALPIALILNIIIRLKIFNTNDQENKPLIS